MVPLCLAAGMWDMVRVLDYGVRIEQAREAVLAIVARDGVAALNQVSLAAELG